MGVCTKRAPVVLQMSAADCGAACLTMIRRCFGDDCTLNENRQILGAGVQGVTALALTAAARQVGLAAQGYRLDAARIGEIPLPAIVHWEGGHFVVIEHCTPRQITIVDPAIGRQRLSAAEFARSFSGSVLVFSATPDFAARIAAQPQPRRLSTWLSYARSLLRAPGARGLIVQIVLASLTLQLLGLALPAFTAVLVDQVLLTGTVDAITLLAGGMVMLAAAQIVTGMLRIGLVNRLQTRLDAHLMLGFFAHLLRLPHRFFQEHSSGDLLQRFESNRVIREMLTTQLISAVLDGTLIVVYLALLWVLVPLFAGVVLAAASLQTVLLLASATPLHELTQRTLAAQARTTSFLVDALQGIDTIKAGGAEVWSFERWTASFFAENRATLQRSQLTTLINAGLNALTQVTPVLLLWLGTQQVLTGDLTPGELLGLTMLAVSCLTPVASLVSSGQQFQLLRAHLERVIDVLSVPPEQDDEIESAASPILTGSVTVEDLHFAYSPHAPLLAGISFHVEPGQMLAVVGPSGSGKSTLIRLLLGFYRPDAGEICFDGRSIARLAYPQIRRQIGVVFQDVRLLRGTLRENITLGDPSLDAVAIERAARLAAIHEEIVRMPLGYETPVDHGGSGLSGGMRQRIALARALVHRPSLLVLDEATSHLDEATERIIDANLRTLNCTRIVVAHRPSTIQRADLILVLESGRTCTTLEAAAALEIKRTANVGVNFTYPG